MALKLSNILIFFILSIIKFSQNNNINELKTELEKNNLIKFNAFTNSNKKYKINIFKEKEQIIIKGLNKENKKEYLKNFNLNEIKKNIFIFDFNSLDEIIEIFKDIIENNKKINKFNKIIIKNESIILIIPFKLGKIKEINFELKEINKNFLCDEINKIENNLFEMKIIKENNTNEILNNIIKENKLIKDLLKLKEIENKNIKNEIENLKDEMENFRDDLQILNNQFIQYFQEKKSKKIKKQDKKNNKILKLFKQNNSIIENIEFIKLINNFFTPNSNIKYNLLYKASKDGDSSETFHNKCDKKGGTITFIKTENGKIIGGYSSISWENKGGFKKDENAFLFSLENKKKFILKNKTDNFAVCHLKQFGPIFGEGADLLVHNHSLENNKSFTKLFSYKSNDDGKNLLNGVNKTFFKIVDYEVYQIIIN